MRAIFPKAPFSRTTAAHADVVVAGRLPHQGLPAHPITIPVSHQLFYTTSIGSLPGSDEFRAAVARESPPPLQPTTAAISAGFRSRPPPPVSAFFFAFDHLPRQPCRCALLGVDLPYAGFPPPAPTVIFFFFFFFFYFFPRLSLAFQRVRH